MKEELSNDVYNFGKMILEILTGGKLTSAATNIHSNSQEALLREVYNGNEVLLASHAVSVEEFMPDRIKVDLSGAAKKYASGSNVALTATAFNLFGPPASNRNYEMESQLKRKGFSAAAFPEFVFDIPGETAFERQRRQGITNEQGQATESFPLAAALKDIAVLEGKMF
jgi:uncharacterized protein YfaS (alpha-2-macroglobulin family)